MEKREISEVSSYKDASSIGLGPHLTTSFNLNYLPKSHTSKSHWGIEFQHVNLGVGRGTIYTTIKVYGVVHIIEPMSISAFEKVPWTYKMILSLEESG